MNEQTKAQRLAEQLDKEQIRTVYLDVMHCDAAAELRRLDALNAELVAALYGAVDSLQDYVGMVGDASDEDADNLKTALAVLAKAKEQT